MLGIKESYQASEVLKEILFNSEKRVNLFNAFLELENDMSKDWFHVYFEEELANKKKYAQDFTPNSITTLVSKILETGKPSFNMDVAAGTGALTIRKWYEDRLTISPFIYRPSMFFYHLEELSDRAIPFLLFNMAIRGMNAVVLHGDVLSRTFKQVYFIQNDADDFMGYSSINVMPHSKELEGFLDIRHWDEEEIKHIESPNFWKGEMVSGQ